MNDNISAIVYGNSTPDNRMPKQAVQESSQRVSSRWKVKCHPVWLENSPSLLTERNDITQSKVRSE